MEAQMARISIYVSDDLKAKIDAIGDEVNWSEVAQLAFRDALANFEHRKERNMTTTIARLSASKELALQNDFLLGKEAGRDYAADDADYQDLRRLSRINFPNDDYRGAGRALARALDPRDERSQSDVFEECFGDDAEDVTDAYIAGFIEGAKEFYNEVKHQL